jgi:hypothetical protein
MLDARLGGRLTVQLGMIARNTATEGRERDVPDDSLSTKGHPAERDTPKKEGLLIVIQ